MSSSNLPRYRLPPTVIVGVSVSRPSTVSGPDSDFKFARLEAEKNMGNFWEFVQEF